MTTWTTASRPTSSSWTSRETRATVSDTISPIITGVWNDSFIWEETGKYWNDTGDFLGLTTPNWITRVTP